MPAYLDYKAKSMPTELPKDYYVGVAVLEEGPSQEEGGNGAGGQQQIESVEIGV